MAAFYTPPKAISLMSSKVPHCVICETYGRKMRQLKTCSFPLKLIAGGGGLNSGLGCNAGNV